MGVWTSRILIIGMGLWSSLVFGAEIKYQPMIPRNIDVKWKGPLEVVYSSEHQALPATADAFTTANYHLNDSINMLKDAQSNLQKISERKKAAEARLKEINDKAASGRLLSSAEKEERAQITEDLPKLQTELENATAAVLESEAQRLAAAGRAGQIANCGGGCGGGGGGSGGLGTVGALLVGAAAGAAVGAAIGAAAAGGGGDEKQPAPQQSSNVADADAQAQVSAHDRALLDGQLANLGELRDRNFASMDMQTAAFATVILSGPAPVTGSLGIGSGGSSLTYGGMTDQQASFGVPTICFSQANLQVPCFGAPGSHGIVSQKPVKCYDANRRPVPCPGRPTAAN